MTDLRITVTSLRRASARERETGLIAFVTVVINDALRVDGLTVRETRGGRVMVMYPERADGSGRKHALIWPLTSETRAAIERAVLAALDLDAAQLGAANDAARVQADSAR